MQISRLRGFMTGEKCDLRIVRRSKLHISLQDHSRCSLLSMKVNFLSKIFHICFPSVLAFFYSIKCLSRSISLLEGLAQLTVSKSK
jgi:hypothetical protein